MTCVISLVYCIYLFAITNLYLQYITPKVNEVRQMQKQTRLDNIQVQ
jgi:hypothetical protein